MLHIDYRDSRPLYEQIADEFEHMAVCGVMAGDTQLPSVRQLAVDLSINPNTIQRAYAVLEQRGVIYSVKGRGNFITPDCSQLRQNKLEQLRQQLIDSACAAIKLGATKEHILSWAQQGITQGEVIL